MTRTHGFVCANSSTRTRLREFVYTSPFAARRRTSLGAPDSSPRECVANLGVAGMGRVRLQRKQEGLDR